MMALDTPQRSSSSHLVDAVDAPECLFDGAGTQRAVQARDAGADAGMSFEVARLLVPQSRRVLRGTGRGRGGHGDSSPLLVIG
jgi:hypothetical protein